MQELLRYSCQIALPGFEEKSQLLLQKAKVLIVGAGGLGCPAAIYLASTGVGTIGIADPDIVSISNLHRQVLYGPGDVGLKKAKVASEKLRLQNPSISINSIEILINSANVFEIISGYDIVIDCTDNFDSRYLLNDACVITGKPLVYGAIFQYEGQVAIWNVKTTDGMSPNYRDVFPNVDPTQVPNCSEGGVLPGIAGIIGCYQAIEAIKYLTGIGELLSGKLLMVDVKSHNSRLITIGALTRTKITEIDKLNVPTISPEELNSLMTQNNFKLIDVRTSEERDSYSLGGLHIPLKKVSELIEHISPEPVIFYCETGKRSGEAAKAMLLKFPNSTCFYSLEGGIRNWKSVYGCAATQLSPSS